MNSKRIKEIHEKTAYPESKSTYQALFQVWNECSIEQKKVLEEAKSDQNRTCTAAVDMAFYHAKSHGYTKKETREHVLMMCRNAGEK